MHAILISFDYAGLAHFSAHFCYSLTSAPLVVAYLSSSDEFVKRSAIRLLPCKSRAYHLLARLVQPISILDRHIASSGHKIEPKNSQIFKSPGKLQNQCKSIESAKVKAFGRNRTGDLRGISTIRLLDGPVLTRRYNP